MANIINILKDMKIKISDKNSSFKHVILKYPSKNEQVASIGKGLGLNLIFAFQRGCN